VANGAGEPLNPEVMRWFEEAEKGRERKGQFSFPVLATWTIRY